LYSLTKRIRHIELPDEIILSCELLSESDESKNKDEAESTSGAFLIRRMAKKHMAVNHLEVYTLKNEKPKAFTGDNELSVSFSHTKDAISAAISFEYLVGCDIESSDRSVSPALVNRMRGEFEAQELYKLDEIRIWTCKEAALKMIGTGLRKPMRSVNLFQLDVNLFGVEIDNEIRAKICSFKHNKHWISICYRK